MTTTIKIASIHTIFLPNAICLSKRTGYEYTSDLNEPIYYCIYGSHINPMALLKIRETTKCKFIIFQSEHYSSPAFSNKYYIQLLQQSYIVDYLPANKQWLEINWRLFCISYHWFEFPPQNPLLIRPIDILFIGAKSDERVAVELLLKNKHPHLQIKFIYPDKYTDISNILKSAVTVLNIEYYKNNFETHRINQALSCGCNIISHETNHLHELYKDYISFTNDFESCRNVPTKSYADLVENQSYVVSMHLKWSLQMVSEREID